MLSVQDKTTVELAQEPRVSKSGMAELGVLFNAYTDNSLPYWFSDLYNTTQPDIVLTRATPNGTYPVKYSGKIAKRLAQLAKNRFDVKLTPDQISTLGNVAAKNRITSESVTYDITDSFDWRSGDYGDGGSCFWSDRSAAKPAMEGADCRALRFYGEYGGIARAWIAPISSKSIVLFNAYAQSNTWISQNGSTLSAMATFLQEQHGFVNRKKVSLRNNGTDSGTLWINSGTGIVLYNGKEPRSHIDLHIDIDEDGEQCALCGEFDDNIFYIQGENISVCEHCFCDHFSHCEYCEEVYHSDSMQWIESEEIVLCEYCYRDNFAECDDCGEVCEKDSLIDGLCDDCSKGKIAKCADCGEVYTDDIPSRCTEGKYKTIWDDIAPLWVDCGGKIMIRCADCGDKIEYQFAHFDVDGLAHCDKCKVHMPVKCAVCEIIKAERFTSRTGKYHYCLHCQPALFNDNTIWKVA